MHEKTQISDADNDGFVVIPYPNAFIPDFGIQLYIQRGRAFGTGSHPCTVYCLKALKELLISCSDLYSGNILYAGAGTGILSIAAARLGAKNITAAEISPESVMEARENYIINNMADMMSLQQCSVTEVSGQFDIILANLFGELLISIAPTLFEHLASGEHVGANCKPTDAAEWRGEMKNPKSEIRNRKGTPEKPRSRHRGWLLQAALLWAGVLLVQAQPYGVDWQSIDGGGGVSSGGNYTLSGVIGQPDAGRLAGGNYAIEGGFLAVTVATEAPLTPVMMRIMLTSTNTVLVTWPAPATGLALRQSSTLENDDWMDVPVAAVVVGNENQVIISPTAGSVFYRLEQR